MNYGQLRRRERLFLLIVGLGLALASGWMWFRHSA
jgi:hypothetical protein